MCTTLVPDSYHIGITCVPKVPQRFPEASQKVSQKISRRFPEGPQEVPRRFPKRFPTVSTRFPEGLPKVPRRFPECSPEPPESFPEVPRRFPEGSPGRCRGECGGRCGARNCTRDIKNAIVQHCYQIRTGLVSYFGTTSILVVSQDILQLLIQTASGAVSPTLLF